MAETRPLVRSNTQPGLSAFAPPANSWLSSNGDPASVSASHSPRHRISPFIAARHDSIDSVLQSRSHAPQTIERGSSAPLRPRNSFATALALAQNAERSSASERIQRQPSPRPQGAVAAAAAALASLPKFPQLVTATADPRKRRQAGATPESMMADVKARVQAAIAAREAASRQTSVPFRAPVFNSFLSSSGRESPRVPGPQRSPDVRFEHSLHSAEAAKLATQRAGHVRAAAGAISGQTSPTVSGTPRVSTQHSALAVRPDDQAAFNPWKKVSRTPSEVSEMTPAQSAADTASLVEQHHHQQQQLLMAIDEGGTPVMNTLMPTSAFPEANVQDENLDPQLQEQEYSQHMDTRSEPSTSPALRIQPPLRGCAGSGSGESSIASRNSGNGSVGISPIAHPSPPPVPLPIREADDLELGRELDRLRMQHNVSGGGLTPGWSGALHNLPPLKLPKRKVTGPPPVASQGPSERKSFEVSPGAISPLPHQHASYHQALAVPNPVEYDPIHLQPHNNSSAGNRRRDPATSAAVSAAAVALLAAVPGGMPPTLPQPASSEAAAAAAAAWMLPQPPQLSGPQSVGQSVSSLPPSRQTAKQSVSGASPQESDTSRESSSAEGGQSLQGKGSHHSNSQPESPAGSAQIIHFSSPYKPNEEVSQVIAAAEELLASRTASPGATVAAPLLPPNHVRSEDGATSALEPEYTLTQEISLNGGHGDEGDFEKSTSSVMRAASQQQGQISQEAPQQDTTEAVVLHSLAVVSAAALGQQSSQSQSLSLPTELQDRGDHDVQQQQEQQQEPEQEQEQGPEEEEEKLSVQTEGEYQQAEGAEHQQQNPVIQQQQQQQQLEAMQEHKPSSPDIVALQPKSKEKLATKKQSIRQEIRQFEARMSEEMRAAKARGPIPLPLHCMVFQDTDPTAYVSQPGSPREADSEFEDAKSGAVRVGIADSAPQGSIGDSNKNSNSGSDDTGGLPTVKMQLREAAIVIGATRFGSGMPIVGKQSEATMAAVGPSESLAVLMSGEQRKAAALACRSSFETARAAAVAEATQKAEAVRLRQWSPTGGGDTMAGGRLLTVSEPHTAAGASDDEAKKQQRQQKDVAAFEATDRVSTLRTASYFKNNRSRIINEKDVNSSGGRQSMAADADSDDDRDQEALPRTTPLRGWSVASPEEIIAAAFESEDTLEQKPALHQQPAQRPTHQSIAANSTDSAAILGMSHRTFKLISNNASPSNSSPPPRQDDRWQHQSPSDEQPWVGDQVVGAATHRPARRKDWSMLTANNMLPAEKPEPTAELGHSTNSKDSRQPSLDMLAPGLQISRPLSMSGSKATYVPPVLRATKFSEQQVQALTSNDLSWVMFVSQEAKNAAVLSEDKLSDYGGSASTSRPPSTGPIEQMTGSELAVEKPSLSSVAQRTAELETAAAQLLDHKPIAGKLRQKDKSLKSKFKAFFGGAKHAQDITRQHPPTPELPSPRHQQGHVSKHSLSSASSGRTFSRPNQPSSSRPKAKQQPKAEGRALRTGEAALPDDTRTVSASSARNGKPHTLTGPDASNDANRNGAQQDLQSTRRRDNAEDVVSRSGRSTPAHASTPTGTSESAYSQTFVGNSAGRGMTSFDNIEVGRHHSTVSAGGHPSSLHQPSPLPSPRGNGARPVLGLPQRHTSPLPTPAASRRHSPLPSPAPSRLPSRHPSPIPSPRSARQAQLHIAGQQPPLRQTGAPQGRSSAESSATRDPERGRWAREYWANVASSSHDAQQPAARVPQPLPMQPPLTSVWPKPDRPRQHQPLLQPMDEAPSTRPNQHSPPPGRPTSLRGPPYQPGSAAAQTATLLALRPRRPPPFEPSQDGSTPRLMAGPSSTPPRSPGPPERVSSSPPPRTSSPYLSALTMEPLTADTNSSSDRDEGVFGGTHRSRPSGSSAFNRPGANVTSPEHPPWPAPGAEEDTEMHLRLGQQQDGADSHSDGHHQTFEQPGAAGDDFRSQSYKGSVSKERSSHQQVPRTATGEAHNGRRRSVSARITADLLLQRPSTAAQTRTRRTTSSRGGPPDSATISHLSSARLARLDRQLAEDSYNALPSGYDISNNISPGSS